MYSTKLLYLNGFWRYEKVKLEKYNYEGTPQYFNALNTKRRRGFKPRRR